MKSTIILLLILLIGIQGITQSKTLYPYKENGKYGYRSGMGKVVVPAKYDTVHDFKFGRGYIIQDGKVGVIDHTGEFIFKPIYSYHQAFEKKGMRSNIYIVGNENKMGLVNINDDLILPLEYDSVYWSRVPSNYFAINKKKIELIHVSKKSDSAFTAISGKYDSINVIRAGKDVYYKAFSKKKSSLFNAEFINVEESAIQASKDKYEVEVAKKNKEHEEMLKGEYAVVDISNVKEEKKQVEIYEFVEQQPEFPGGVREFMTFVQNNIRYPENSKRNFIQGRVYIKFLVTKEGEISNPKVIKGINKEIDSEAERLIMSMPKWKPGKQRGKVVDCYYTMPVEFKIPAE